MKCFVILELDKIICMKNLLAKIVFTHASSGNHAMPTPELLIPHNFSYFTKDLFTFSQQNCQWLVGVMFMAVTLHAKGLGFETSLRCLFYFNLLVKYENL